MPLPPPHLSPAVRAGELLFLSGQLGFDEAGKLNGDVAEQTRRCLSNVAKALREHGLGLGDVVKATAWITRAEDFAGFNQAYAEAFGDHRPARSTVVSGLALAEALVEIEVVARCTD